MAKTWGTTPSAHLGIPMGSYQAWCVDEAIAWFGNTLKAELDNAKGKTEKAKERRRRLILHTTFAGELGGPKYADPAAKFAKANDDKVDKELEELEAKYRESEGR